MVDEKTGEKFKFHLTEPKHPWFWQRAVLDTLMAELRVIILKARQIGITWVACGFALWLLLTKPGTRVLAFRQKEDQAVELVRRVWQQYQGLPEHLRFGVKVITPARGAQPTRSIQFQHPDGSISTIEGFPSTESSAHGQTAAFVLIDEAAYIDLLQAIFKAVNSTIGVIGRFVLISTGNGISNPDGSGNYFHRLWADFKERQLVKLFLSWRVHPDRDDEWYHSSPEVAALDIRDRKEQYPADEHEAFLTPGSIYYDPDALDWYAANALRAPIDTFSFEPLADNPRRARKASRRDGLIDLFQEPDPKRLYAIGGDVATGHGKDYSCAYVVDLATMELCAEVHGRIDDDRYATQLHFLGKYFGISKGCAKDAKLATEIGNGWGQPVSIYLRDGRAGRPPYSNLYQHELSNRPDQKRAHNFGYPVHEKTRPLILSQLGRALREHALPWITPGLLRELKTFVEDANARISPCAMKGCNDDRIMGVCITLELYRQFGHWPEKPKTKKPKSTYKPWLPLNEEAVA